MNGCQYEIRNRYPNHNRGGAIHRRSCVVRLLSAGADMKYLNRILTAIALIAVLGLSFSGSLLLQDFIDGRNHPVVNITVVPKTVPTMEKMEKYYDL